MGREIQEQIWSTKATDRKELMVRYLVPAWTALLDATQAAEHTKLLDAGCGSGELVGLALARGCEVTGIDNAQRMIELCRADQELVRATFLEGSTDDLPFEDNVFDAATAAMSIHFCDDVPRAMTELFRVIKPGGRVAISAPLATTLDVLIVFQLALELVKSPHADIIRRPLMFAVDGKLAQGLETAGFGDVKEGVVDTPFAAKAFEDLWEIQKTWAPVQLAADVVGEADFLAAYQQRLQERLGTATPSRLEMKYRIVSGVKR